MVQVFVTGGTGFVGSQVIKALLANGHTVAALARRIGTQLDDLGVRVIQGSLQDIDTVVAAAKEAAATLHVGFDHDFSKYVASSAQDTAVVTAISEAYAGSGKLFAMTSAIALCGDTGAELADDDKPAFGPRAASESAILQGQGFQAVVFRLPPFVYSKDASFCYDALLKAAQNKGSTSFVGTGANVSSAVHVDDLATAYVSLLTHPTAQGIYNIVAENGITGKVVAEVIASKLKCKTASISAEEASQQLGIVAKFTSINCQGDSSKAQQELKWQPQYTNFKEVI